MLDEEFNIIKYVSHYKKRGIFTEQNVSATHDMSNYSEQK